MSVASMLVDAHGHCAECGFDPDQLAPTDAAAAVRSLARRWRELVERVAERELDGEGLLRQRLSGGWSPLERASHVVDVIESKAERLMRVWEQERPVLDEVGIAAGRATANTADRSDLLAQLGAAAERLARVIERYEGVEWNRAGLRSGLAVTAWELAAEAVHEASHHLRACHDDLTRAGARSLDDDQEED